MTAVIKTYFLLAIIGGIALGLSLLFGISPCIIYHVAGIPCPACGLTRAFISLARLDFGQAFAYPPLFLAVILLPFLAFERISPKWRNILSFSLLGVFIVVWIVRMVLLFPDTPPMTFNENSLLSRWLN